MLDFLSLLPSQWTSTMRPDSTVYSHAFFDPVALQACVMTSEEERMVKTSCEWETRRFEEEGVGSITVATRGGHVAVLDLEVLTP